MTQLYTHVEQALTALFRLEDELDRPGFLAGDADVELLERLVRRWESDTHRKIQRELNRAGREATL